MGPKQHSITNFNIITIISTLRYYHIRAVSVENTAASIHLFLPPSWRHAHAHCGFAHRQQPLRWLKPFLKHWYVKLYELIAPHTLKWINSVTKLCHFVWNIIYCLSRIKFKDRWVVFFIYDSFCWTRGGACAARSDVFSDRCQKIRASANLSALYHPKFVPEFGWTYKETTCAVKYAGNTMCIWILDFVGRPAHVVAILARRHFGFSTGADISTNFHHHNRSVLSIFTPWGGQDLVEYPCTP